MTTRIVRGELVLGHLAAPSLRTARGLVAGRASLTLVLSDDDGTLGIGEAAPLPGFSLERLEDTERALSSWLARGPFELDASAPVAWAIEALVAALPPIPSARFALETALLDLTARRAGVPVWSLLAEEAEARPLSALLTGATPDALAEEAAACVARGFGTLKVKVGAPGVDDRAGLAAVRRAAPAVRLRLDANGGGALPISAIVELFEDFAAELIEEPGSFEPPLPEHVRVALDESLLTEAGVVRGLELAERGRIAAFVLKPALLGGILPARRLAAAAETRGVPSLVTHSLDGPIGHLAAAHLAWSLPRSPYADGLAPHAGLASEARSPARRAEAVGWVHPSRAPQFASEARSPARRAEAVGWVHPSRAPQVASEARSPAHRAEAVGWVHPSRAPQVASEARSPGRALPTYVEGALLVPPQRGSARKRRAPRTEDADELSIFDAARSAPLEIAIVDEHGESHTFASVAARVAEARAVLAPEPGAPHALVGAPRLAEIVAALALLDARAPIVWLHPRATESERARILEETGARLLDASASTRTTPERRPENRLPAAARDAALLLYTSGSSGRPKAALLGRAALLAAARASLERLGVARDDRLYLGMPLAHVGGLSVLLRGILARKTVVLGRGERFDARAVAGLFARESITVASLVPTMLHRLLEEPSLQRRALRTILLGGAAATPSLLARAHARGLPVRTTYGLTETCAAATIADEGALEGVGRALEGVELAVRPEERGDREGTIRVRGPTLMTGYLRLTTGGDLELDPARDGEGWFDTGDFGSIDERGQLTVIARRTDLIVRGGENVYPAEVEAALEDFPAIARACVFGVEDEVWGAQVCAAIVARAPLDEDALVEHLRHALAVHKRPTRVAELSALAELASGKLDRGRVQAVARPLLRTLRR